MFLDSRAAGKDAVWSASLCIIGAGPAGLALADVMRATGRSIVLLERGTAAMADDRLMAFEPGNALRLEGTRAAATGGTSSIWNTYVRGEPWAKYVPLDASDFTRREWVPFSGWPLTRDAMTPWYREAQALCGLSTDADSASATDAWAPLLPGRYGFGPSARFCREAPEALRQSTNVLLVEGATATGITRSRDGRVTAVQWVGTEGARGAVHTDTVVLAGGGLENARFLLDDRDTHRRTTSPHDWLGRGFMEHPIDPALRIAASTRVPGLHTFRDSTAPAADRWKDIAAGQPVPFAGRIGFAAELLHDERLPNMSLRWVEEHADAFEPSGMLRAGLRVLVPSRRLRRRIGDTARGARRLLQRARPTVHTTHALLLDLEQWPHPDNRVVLTGARNRYGQAVAALQWRWRDDEEALRQRAHRVIAREFARLGLGEVIVVPSTSVDPHAHHHAGTTRMHEDPSQGVVDADLRVHGEDNLYVLGSSVFPTAGVANPTLTIVALAARLAAHLSNDRRVGITDDAAMPS